jgi:RND superfamily putative drug exporter
MLTALAEGGIAAPRRVIAAAGVLIVVGLIFGLPVASKLGAGGFFDTSAPSSAAGDLLATRFHTGDTNIVLELRTGKRGLDKPATRALAMRDVRHLTNAPYVDSVLSYWTAPSAEIAAALASHDHDVGLIQAHVAGDDSTAPERAAAAVKPLTGVHNGVTVTAGGGAIAYQQANDDVKEDLARAELIAIPLTALALIWVFGSVVASLLPIAVGLTCIVGTMAILRGLSLVTDVSIYALNMTTATGLALAIDYSLLIVSRYREEVTGGLSTSDAVRRTMQTAGRTVLFSALTVGLSLLGMLVFPMYFMRSFAYAGMAVVALAAIAALVILPAVLVLIGRHIDSLDVRVLLRRLLRRPPLPPKALERTFWYRFARVVQRRAVYVAVGVTAFLVFLVLPFTHVKFAFPDERVLPPSASAYQVASDLVDKFGTGTDTIDIAVPSTQGRTEAVDSYAERLSRIKGVKSVASYTGTYANGKISAAGDPTMLSGGATYLEVTAIGEPASPAQRQALAAVEAEPAPWPIDVGGDTALERDSLATLSHAMPYAAAIIALTIFVLLFLFTGSVVMPLKALVLNTLSLSATFGAMVWIFQYGHLKWLFPDVTITGSLAPTMPVLMFCLAFGLSMDYEVFLLSRIREEWLSSSQTRADNSRAVALGLGRTGRIVTAAALLMAIVFAALSRGRVEFMMLFGTGLTLAVLMDATIVRGTLVPAFMELAGRWNWWAPKPLARLHARFGLSDEPSRREPVVSASTVVAAPAPDPAPAAELAFRSRRVMADLAEELYAAMRAEAVGVDSPVDRLCSYGVGYVRFAVAYPDHYRAAAAMSSSRAAVGAGSVPALQLVEAEIVAAMRAGSMANGDPLPILLDLWATAHGIASLLIATPSAPWGSLETVAGRVFCTAVLRHTTGSGA